MQAFVLKILSGPMFGVDVGLPDDNVHLFFCDSEAIEKNHTESVYQHAINSLLIPCAKDNNTRIFLRISTREMADTGECVTEATAQLIPLEDRQVDAEEEAEDQKNADQSIDIISVPLNVPIQIGHAVIALKSVSEVWSDEVIAYSFPHPDMEATSTTDAALAVPPEKRHLPYFKLTLGGILCLASVALLFVLFLPSKVGTVKDTLSTLNPGITQNKNGDIYILTKTEPEAQWSENALRKSNLAANNITVLAKSVELSRMKKLLSEQVIPFFDIKFTADFAIKILLSRERSAGSQYLDKTVQKLLFNHFPYLATVDIERVSDGVVLANARERLKSLGLYSQNDITANHVTFSINGEVDDFQLGNLRRQINEFYEQYGDEYVKFIVNLNEDPLRNRTFKTGADSYVVVPGNHWLYSNISTTH